MYLQRLSLIDFKNVGEAQIELSPQINCMVGDNGTGKTNLLDAVHYLSMCKSAFGLSDTQCVRHGSEAFLVDGRYGEPATDRTERIVCSFKKGGQKKLCRNGKEYEKLSDHIGLIPLVLVTPSDTALINESGEERRKYLNSFISQLDREYLSALVRYNRLLAERNKLLKRQQSPGFEELIEVFDAQLCPLAATLWQKRKELVSELAPVVAGYYAALSGDRERVGLGYRSELNERPMDRILRETAQRDRINQFTSGGVHRDDMLMSIGDYPLRKYGSQGQQKSFLIALKLAQYTIVAQEKGEKPILLLDDLFDKLDAGRVEQLIRLVSEDSFGQIVITDCNPTRLRRILDKAGGAYSLFTVENGGIGQETATAGAPACGGQLPAEERAKEAADQTRHAGPQEAGAAEGIRTAAVQGEVSEDLRNAASAGEKSGGKDARGTDTADTASGGKEGAR